MIFKDIYYSPSLFNELKKCVDLDIKLVDVIVYEYKISLPYGSDKWKYEIFYTINNNHNDKLCFSFDVSYSSERKKFRKLLSKKYIINILKRFSGNPSLSMIESKYDYSNREDILLPHLSCRKILSQTFNL
jgi:hypothetical protein